MARERIQPSVWDEAWVTAAGAALSLSSSPDPLQIHLVIDTGLGREGCLPNAAAMLARSVVGAAAAGGADMRVAGVSTHFCCPSDAQATTEAWRVISEQHAIISAIVSNSSSRTARPLLHAASGAPTALFPHTQADMVRIGGLLFGILPAAGGVRQALASAGATPQRAIRWLTTVVGVKQLPHGSCVGYECAARTGGGPVALLPLGSHDGFLEPSAGFTHVVVRGYRRLVLAVDANMVIVQVTAGVEVGDEVVILGCDASAPFHCATPILSTRIPAHLARFYI